MYGYIYITTDLLTGKKYIGKHKAETFEFDTYKGSGIDICKIPEEERSSRLLTTLLPEINNVPTICENAEDLDTSERYYIEYYNCVLSEEFYNRISGGSGGDIYSQLSPEKQHARNTVISEKSRYWWEHATDEERLNRYQNWFLSYNNKTAEELEARSLRNSSAQIAYNKSIPVERRAELNQKLKAAAQLRVNDPDKEKQRKEREKLTKSKQTLAQKEAYRIKQQAQQRGRHYYTDGVRKIRCKPEDVPDGFYQCKGHSNTAKYICHFEGQEYLGLSALSQALESRGYQHMSTDKILRISNDKLYTEKKYPELQGRIIIRKRELADD